MKFYAVVDKSSADAAMEAWMPDGYNTGNAQQCPHCGAYISMLEWLPPYEVILKLRGAAFSDTVLLPGGDLLFSRKFVELWKRNGFVGLSGFEPVRILKVKSRRKYRPDPPDYFRATVDLTNVQIDVAASGIEWDEPPKCPHCLSGTLVRWKRIVVNADTWGGQDLFVAKPMYGVIVASPRFKKLWDEHQLTGTNVIPAEEYGHDFNPWEKSSDQDSQAGTSSGEAENNGKHGSSRG